VRLLLDTHIFLWSAQDPARLVPARATLADPGNDALVSTVVAWEIAIKYALGRLPLPVPPASFVPEVTADLQASALAITHGHALGVAQLPPLHADPFDRLLVAQAIALDATLVTADAVLANYDCRTLLV